LISCQIKDIAEGLAHLHDASIVHGDLHAFNIVLWNKRAVIMDFGLAKLIFRNSKMSESLSTDLMRLFLLPLDRMPLLKCPRKELLTYTVVPELKSHPEDEPNMESDVYLFGVLAKKLLGYNTPLKKLKKSGGDELLALFDECMKSSPEERPDAREVVERIGRIKFPKSSA